MNHFLYQLKRVKVKELLQIWKLPIALVCALIYRIKHKDLWIICEDKAEARDNGYWFFKHVRSEHPEQECVYAISSISPDFPKVSSIGKTVEFGTLKHWIYYLSSSKKISSQKAGNPNAAIFYFLEVYGILKDKRVFLQHGVIINDLKWLYYNVTKLDRFICGAYPEYQFITSTFGYPEENVCYTGLCRFDGLHDCVNTTEQLILIMPTWREWIADEDYRLLEYEGTSIIQETQYFKTWIDFITDDRIKELHNKYHVHFIFFPHRNMQQYISYFPETNQYIEVADAGKYDVQELLKRASLMVTDYSSVFFDMIYMKKPVIYYQFDYDKFRQAQYGEGYFHYNDNPFGKSYYDKDAVFAEIEEYINNKFAVSDVFLQAHSEYFRLYDTDNCERVYTVTKNI